MDLLLKEQDDVLGRLADLLMEEREVLIREDGRRLVELVAMKKNLQADLERAEIRRKKKWGDLSLKEMAARLDKEKADRLMEIGEVVRSHMNEIKELQETNMMLTRQSAAYSQRLMDILQQTVRMSGITYGQNGAVANGQGVMASMDKSV
jgi:flagellar biosynthesis/type III secretory pathway chaperone